VLLTGRFLVCQTATCFIGAGSIDRFAAFLNVGDFAVLINYERRAIGESKLRDQDSVLFRYFAHMIAKHRVRCAEFLFPVR